MRRCTNAIHNSINQSFQLLDVTFGKVLMLVVWLTLPICNAIGAQNFLDLVAYFDLSTVADKLGWCSPGPNLVLQCINELVVSFDSINICNKGFNANKNLSNGSAWVNSWGGRIYGICSHRFISPVNIKSRKWGLIPLLKESGHREVGILSGFSKGLLDHIGREPSEHGLESLIVRSMSISWT